VSTSDAMGDPNSGVLRGARRTRGTTLRAAWPTLFAMSLTVAAVTAAGWWAAGLIESLAQDAGPAATVPWAAATVVLLCALMMTGAALFMATATALERAMGTLAEYRTARAFRELGDDWHAVPGASFSGRIVDYMAVGPDRVLAVRSQWTARQPTNRRSRLAGTDPAWLDGARRNASAMELCLRPSVPGLSVTPALVVWGPGVPDDVDEVRTLYGVHVLRGRRGIEQWNAVRDRHPVTVEATRVLTAMETYRRHQAVARATAGRAWPRRSEA
jgi:hypothetical protein